MPAPSDNSIQLRIPSSVSQSGPEAVQTMALTEIFIIYSGMGKLFLNGYKTKDSISKELHERGYLNENILKYILQIYISRLNINLQEYHKSLTQEGKDILTDILY